MYKKYLIFLYFGFDKDCSFESRRNPVCRRREVVPEKIKTLPRPACAFSRIFPGFESIGGAGDIQLAPGRKDDSSRNRGYPPIPAARTRTEGVPPGFRTKKETFAVLASPWAPC